MQIKSILASALLGGAALSASAADFFDASQPESLFNIGFRFGINTSNRTVSKNVFPEWHNNAWGTGIDVGAVVDLNFRDWLSIQPGLFFESRSGCYAYVCEYRDEFGEKQTLSQYGHDRSYNFTVPILCVAHFNVTDNVRWNVEAGPYLQFIIKDSVNDKFQYPAAPADFALAKGRNFDFGIKAGSSLTILKHYNFGIHYLAGWLHPWKGDVLGGCRKGWVFSIGYNL